MRRVKEGMFVCCRVGDLLVGIDLNRVQEINRLVDPTPVPLMPEHVRGVVNLRGNLVSILDINFIVRQQATEVGPRTRTVALESGHETVGLLIDEVGDVVDIEGHTVEQLNGLVPDEQRQWFTGLVQLPDQLLLILDLEAIDRCGTEDIEVSRR